MLAKKQQQRHEKNKTLYLNFIVGDCFSEPQRQIWSWKDAKAPLRELSCSKKEGNKKTNMREQFSRCIAYLNELWMRDRDENLEEQTRIAECSENREVKISPKE